MEIKKESKLKKFFKRYGALSLACVLSLSIALGIGLGVSQENGEGEPVSNVDLTFGLPMNNAVVVKDYSEEKLQLNEVLGRYEVHLAVDFASEENQVFSIFGGVVAEVDSNSLDGHYIKIEHDDGLVSVYSSLSDDLKVQEGDLVSKGQLIGFASESSGFEDVEGGHLHFMMLKDGVEVDPNNYLDLQNK